MLRINKKLSKKGFILIELMVAVVILAIAVVGIFLAFSNAWMGMADARDRTVATNYAREAMENIKNMNFEMVTNENLGTAESLGAKFTRVIIVNTESDNLKKIDTKVFWTNRRNQYVSVEPSMYINRTLLNPGEATHIILYANPYYTVLPSIGSSTIIAVIKDSDGNTKIDWDGADIQFSITSASQFPKNGVGSFLGYFVEDPEETEGTDTKNVPPDEGIARTIFKASGHEISPGVPAQGYVVIEASVDLPNDGGTISDTITINVTLDVVRIELLADPESIDADGSISTVTAALVNSGGATVTDASNDITFSFLEEGIGTFVEYSDESPLLNPTTIEPSGGIAKIKVKSISGIPGVATVTASSVDLLSDTVNIIITGDAASISVSVQPNFIYEGDTDGAMVIVEIQDINGNPVNYTGTINLSTTPDAAGTFGSNNNPLELEFDDISLKYTTFSPTFTGIVTINANVVPESGPDLEPGNADIEVGTALIATNIALTAVPKNILAGGFNNSEITATIKQGSTVISNYSNDVTFEIISDTSNSHNASLSYNSSNYGIGPFDVLGGDVDDGEVMVYLMPSDDVGICTIKVSTVNSLGDTIDNTVEVGFYSGEDHIELIADQSKMLVGGDSCEVTAIVVDEDGTKVETYEEDITFTILIGWPKNAKFTSTGTSSLTKTLTGGDTTVGLISQSEAGTVTLKATSFTGSTNITGYLNIPVVISLLELATVPNIDYSGNQVSFDIEVQGTEITLNEMKVSWLLDDSETLNKIEINPNSTGNIIIYPDTATPVSSGEPIDVDDITLWEGISHVILSFNASMSEKTLEVIFNPNSGNYHVEINEPPT